MWAPNLSSFTRLHWYFGVHIFNELLKKSYLHCIPWINLNIIFMRATWYEVDPMKSLTLDNVLSVANSENKSES